MVTRRSRAVEFRDALQCHFFQYYFLYFDTLLARYTEVKYQLKQYFFHTSLRFDKLLNGIDNVLQKRRF